VRSRKQAWLRDELILALDLYVREGKGAATQSRQKVSDLLRSFPIERHLAEDPKFRSEKAVSYKLHNFVGIDPSDPTVGFSHGGAGDAEVWGEFAHDPGRLAATAASIALEIESERPAPVYWDEEDPDEADAPEGKLLTRRHRQRERSSKLVKQKKDQARKRYGKLACEACDFDFSEHYGERGDGFIECHHTVPVMDLAPGSRTRLADLVLLCSNCHRIVHRRAPWLTMSQLVPMVSSGAPSSRGAPSPAV
jgi:5-methylcytosine-specific restriction enzyme A